MSNGSEMEQIFTEIQEYALSQEIYYSHLIVDGAAIFESYQTYISNNADLITDVELIFLTQQQHAEEVLESVSQYVPRALPYMEELATTFYQGGSAAAWSSFNQLLEGIDWIIQSVDALSAQEMFEDISASLTKLSTDLRGSIIPLSEALQLKDTTMIADIIQYEVKPVFQSLDTVVGAIMASKGV